MSKAFLSLGRKDKVKSKGINTALEKYLSLVDRYLSYMPVSEKTDILSELKSSFYERMETGQTEEEILDQMEDPKALAASYIGQSLVKNRGFSWRKFMMALGFYSFASVSWAAVIPTLAVLAGSFFFSCGVSVLAGVMGFLKGIVHIPLIDDLRFVFFVYELKGLPALVIGLLLAAAFLVLGLICWKGTAGMARFLQSKKWKLDHAEAKAI